ncbi:hypothetical protein ES708_12191 [subsurface metagenome]
MSSPQDAELQIYEVTNKLTGEKRYQPATNAEDACKQTGWLIADCFAIEAKPQRKPRRDDHSAMLIKIPCETCPFQYGECKKLPEADCPVRPAIPELQEWLKRTAEAHLCPYVGKELTKKDYQLKQKWVTIEEAIDELAPKS